MDSGFLIDILNTKYSHLQKHKAMKTKAFTLLMLLGIISNAQITITANDAPQPGDVFINAHDTTVENIYSGVSGEDVIWDFSILGEDKVDTTFIVQASQVDYNNEYPEATIAEIMPQDTLFLQTTTDALTLLGERNKLYRVKFDDPIKGLQFPITYGTTFQDSGHFLFYSPYDTVVQGVQIDTVNLERSYSLHDTCIAYGTLKLPHATYNNVLMIKETLKIHEKLSVYTQWGWYDVEDSIYTVIRYDVYKNGYGSQLLDLLIDPENGSVKSATYKWTESNPVAIMNNVNLNIYPNPAQNKINVTVPYNQTKAYILNDNGQILSAKDYNSHQFSIEISNLPVGTYFLKVETPVGTATKKFIKE